MHWRITLEAVDPIGDEYRKEFMLEKDLDGLADGKLGCSIEDGKAIIELLPIFWTVLSDKYEPVSARTVPLPLTPRRDRATLRERRRGSA